MRITGSRFVPGRAAGLSEWTAIFEIATTGATLLDAAAETRLRAIAAGLCPEEPLFGVHGPDWPDAFLVPGDGTDLVPSDGADPAALGRWVVALAVAVQRWGRDPVFHGRVVDVAPQRITLAVPWRRRAFCTEAVELAVELVCRGAGIGPANLPTPVQRWLATASQPPALRLRGHFGSRWAALQNGGLSPYSLEFVGAAVRRGMPFDVLPNCIQLGWGAGAERFDMTFSGRTGWIASALAKNKSKSNAFLAGEAVPVPAAVTVSNVAQAEKAADGFGWPVVIKPPNLDQGLGVVAGIRDAAALRAVFDATAKRGSGRVIVEKHVFGEDFRLLVVRGRMLSVVRRVPGGVTGDGIRTVRELVAVTNSDAQRGSGHYSRLKTLVFDAEAQGCLAERGLDADSVPRDGQWVPMRRIANISAGGTAEDVTASTHPENAALAVRAARLVGLDIAGIDLLCPDITRSWREVGGAICEVNSQPSPRVHRLAEPDRDLYGEIIDILFDGRPARIPTAAVSGAGAAETAEALQRIWLAAGVVAGVCTTRMLRIGADVFATDDRTGSRGVRAVMIDPAAAAAVFELPPTRLAAEGHPCDRYDVAAVLGVDGAAATAELVARVHGAVVLNADDPGCLAVPVGAARRILVSAHQSHPAVVEHRRGRGEAVLVDDGGAIVFATGPAETVLGRWSGDRPELFAAALARAHGIDAAVIATALAGAVR